jgi:hypothetical protein
MCILQATTSTLKKCETNLINWRRGTHISLFRLGSHVPPSASFYFTNTKPECLVLQKKSDFYFTEKWEAQIQQPEGSRTFSMLQWLRITGHQGFILLQSNKIKTPFFLPLFNLRDDDDDEA